MIAALFSGFGLKLAGILAAVGTLLGLLFSARHAGVQAQQNLDLKLSVKRVEAAHAALTDVARMSDTAVDHQLRSEFSRDN